MGCREHSNERDIWRSHGTEYLLGCDAMKLGRCVQKIYDVTAQKTTNNRPRIAGVQPNILTEHVQRHRQASEGPINCRDPYVNLRTVTFLLPKHFQESQVLHLLKLQAAAGLCFRRQNKLVPCLNVHNIPTCATGQRWDDRYLRYISTALSISWRVYSVPQFQKLHWQLARFTLCVAKFSERSGRYSAMAALGKFTLDKLNTLWLKWEYVNMTAKGVKTRCLETANGDTSLCVSVSVKCSSESWVYRWPINWDIKPNPVYSY
jgi:hypothetical protein